MQESANKSEQQSKAELLAATVVSLGCTIASAAESLGWSEHTAYKYSGTPEYRAAAAFRMIELADSTAQQGIAAQQKAIETLTRAMDSSDESIAVNAAKGIMQHSTRLQATLDRQLSEARSQIDGRSAAEKHAQDFLESLTGMFNQSDGG